MSENVLDQKLKDLDAAMASQDIQGVNKATIGILTAAHQFLDTAKKELENTDAPGYKEELTEKIGHVENCKKDKRFINDQFFQPWLISIQAC